MTTTDTLAALSASDTHILVWVLLALAVGAVIGGYFGSARGARLQAEADQRALDAYAAEVEADMYHDAAKIAELLNDLYGSVYADPDSNVASMSYRHIRAMLNTSMARIGVDTINDDTFPESVRLRRR